MKKSLLLVSILTILTFIAFAQKEWVSFTSDNPELPQVVIEEQNDTKVILNISIPGMYVSDYLEEGQSFQRLELIENETTMDVGMPELPMLNKIIGIPGNKKIKVSILEQEIVMLEDYFVYPFQTPSKDVKGGNPDEFVIDEKFYSQSKYYPETNIFSD